MRAIIRRLLSLDLARLFQLRFQLTNSSVFCIIPTFLHETNISRIDDVLSESLVILRDHSFSESRPYGQPGPLPMIGISDLLIELKAQFYKLVTL